MSSKINTLDHAVMGLLLKSDRSLSIPTMRKRSKSSAKRVLKSVEKLMALGFVTCRVGSDDLPLHSAVLDCLYFPPVTCVASRVFSFEDTELKTLVAECDKQLLTQ
jgi:hypothetical protein